MKKATKIFFISKLVILFWFVISFFIDIPKVEFSYLGEEGLLNPFTFYDSEHFLWIAKHGYTNNHLYAFFPLYPFLIRLLGYIGLSYPLAGVLISWICSWGVSILLYKMLPEEKKTLGVWLWCLSPIAIYSISVYTESLFVLLSLFAWKLYKDEKYILAGIFAGLSALTRNIGIVFVGMIILDELRKKKRLKEILHFSIPSISIGSIYPLYLWITTGDIFKFATAQSEWGRSSFTPWLAIIRDIKFLFSGSGQEIAIVLNIVVLIFALYLVFKNIKKEPILSVFILLGSILPLFAPATMGNLPSTTSLFRYIFGMFPIYFFILNMNINEKNQKYFYTMYLFTMGIVTTLVFLKRFVG